MYITLVHLTLGCLFLALLLSWIAGNKASSLLYSKSEQQLHQRAKHLIIWTIVLSIPAAAALGGVVTMAVKLPPDYDLGMLICVPILTLSLALLWARSIPKLLRMRKNTGRKSSEPLPVRMLYRASEPAFILPYQLLSLCMLTIFYLTLSVAVSLHSMPLTLPLSMLGFAAAILWIIHGERSSRVTLPKAKLNRRPSERMVRRLAIAIAIVLLAGTPYYNAFDKIDLPEALIMTNNADNMHSFGFYIEQ
ncbi:hypothetical protein SAMN04487969_1159 [Paenibacillus algorifonticola]|uniref:Uncharacterized protein n=1 Tax=Paenibacillus algorifonticola TaxID=684063 RepID=A0A1I2G9I8_9BACL|nr:hypothetical protein [Paenibacillus algorifonticola]SFF13640.1 hypothetical protein SAMN04487969_1159 [Paenibacillus algorifonticola]